jgi:hypothetical protein
MGEHRHRGCLHIEGVAVCGRTATPEDCETITQFGRYLRGEMSAREKSAFTGMDGGNPDDIGRVGSCSGGCARMARAGLEMSTSRLHGRTERRLT